MAPPSLTINYDSFMTSTLTKFKPELQQNFIKWRPAFNELFDNYSHKESGGWQVQINTEFGNNANTKFFNPYDTVDTTPSEFALPAFYKWRHVVSSATVSDVEIAANSGKEKLFDLTQGRIRQATRSMVNLLGSEIYSDGTNFGGNTIIGLAAGVSTTPSTGSVGGIDPASYVYWRNNATTSFGSFAANGVNGTATDLVETMSNNCSDGERTWKFILSAQNVAEYYNKSQLATFRFVADESSKPGDLATNVNSMSYVYKGRKWYWDRQCPSGRMYFLDNESLYFMVDPQMMFEWSEPRMWPNQLTRTRLLTLRTALCYTSRMFTGVCDGITA